VSGDWTNLLGLARRAGKLIAGTEAASQAIRRRQAFLLILADDLAPASQKKLRNLAEFHGVPIMAALTREELGRVTGCPGRGVFAVTSLEFAKLIETQVGRGNSPAG
jgi:ribosomal protein L7Ae-like RNA K-turn-binding protein